MRDGIAFGFFKSNIHLQLLQNRLTNRLTLPSSCHIFALENIGLFKDDAGLVALIQKATRTGKKCMIQIIYGTTNHEAAVELKKALNEAHKSPPYENNDIITGGIYYKRGAAYTRFR